TVTPFAGFTGQVNFNATDLPSGASAVFDPVPVNITNANSATTFLTLTSGPNTPIGNHVFNINAQSGATSHSIPASLNVVSPLSADLSITDTASPNPGQAGVSLSYRIIVTNHGPKPATNVTVTDTLPAGVSFVSATATQGNCNGSGPVICNLGSLDVDSSAIVTIVVVPSSAGQVTNSATVSGSENDSDPTNNTAAVMTIIQPPALTPTMLDDNLTVNTVIAGLDQPTSLAFIGTNDFFVLEKATGKVQRVVNGVLHSTVLDLPVNNASERGLLGIALHPNFAQNGFVYLYWTESSTGADTANVDNVPLLGNRVDRYVWNGTALTFDRNLIKLRALQQDAGQPSRGNHNGGVLRFGPDGKLYIIFGDNGRRGFLQNIVQGGPVPDDQFGGPEPDDAHMTGVILRLNDDGSTPTDNPFINAIPPFGLFQVGNNVRKIFAYGIRNSFGMDFDPLSGALWTQENGDDAFDEMNRVTPGFNGGWIQAMGPVSRVDEFRSIEMSYGAGNLQQLRWPPSNIQTLPQQALIRMAMLPGAQYVDPEFSWKYAVAPSTIGFVKGRGLGPQFEGDLLVGASRTTLLNGFLFRFKLNADRQHFALSDPRLADRVADNVDKFDQTESESLLIGKDFGITTDIQTGPNGNVFVVSLSNGAVYEIKSKPSTLFVATLDGAQETPPNNSTATGRATLLLSPDEKTARVSLLFSGLSSGQTDAHIHGPATLGVSAPPVFPLPLGQISDFQINMTPAQVQDLKNGLFYINVHSVNFPTGEIRGQFASSLSAQSVQFGATNYVVNENAGSVVVNVTRSGNVSNAMTVNYATSNGTATQSADYISGSGSLQFAAGETVKSFVVPIVNDETIEHPESINVVLSSPTAGAIEGSPFTSTITILDDDKPLILIDESTGRAVALDSVTFLGEPFPLTNIHNFSSDHRTRVVVFANGIDLMPGEPINVQIVDVLNRTYPLVVEDVRKVPNFDWLTQIVVRLPDSIDIQGDYRISI
ncbi:MAG TPA: PQQ-dependent sugar dehydrogenase, partial [Pyrinomonadaceae bacterium]|nr:PQQ-dependent sugar dehydrogenase [Pyrinomonadaceae bacterium]